jgi:hypothetical protein
MIDPNKCQTCYPIVAKIFEIKFEGEKSPKQCVLRAWKECDKPAVEHITDYVDPNRPGTMYVLHRCIEHSKPLPKLEVKSDPAEDCFGGTS